jgi:hypothetical protein
MHGFADALPAHLRVIEAAALKYGSPSYGPVAVLVNVGTLGLGGSLIFDTNTLVGPLSALAMDAEQERRPNHRIVSCVNGQRCRNVESIPSLRRLSRLDRFRTALPHPAQSRFQNRSVPPRFSEWPGSSESLICFADRGRSVVPQSPWPRRIERVPHSGL